MNWRHILICWLISAFYVAALPLPAYAQMVFERAKIIIQPATLPATEPAKNDQPPPPARAPIPLEVELRNEDALRLEYIHELNTLSPDTGVMIALGIPEITPLPAMSVFTPVDAIFVDEEGVIIQILPTVILGEMTRSIAARRPIKAFLFLKAGQATARAIRPHDIVVGSSFTPPPPVQE
jgi:hypothetical protein